MTDYKFWVSILIGFISGIFACIWGIGYFLFKDEIKDYFKKKYFKIRNWLHSKLWVWQARFGRWRKA